jgi:hypothetical protein
MTEPFYKYYVIDYYGTGEGRTIFLQISRNNSPQYPEDYFQKRWEKFVDIDFYLQGTEELEEREFLDKYTRFLPDVIAHMLREKSFGIWQTHLHFNWS